MLNREWAVANYIQNDWHAEADGTLYVEHRALDLAISRMRVRFVIVDPNGEPPRFDRPRYPALHSDRNDALLERVGFTDIKAFGGFDGETYGIETRRMILCARKSA